MFLKCTGMFKAMLFLLFLNLCFLSFTGYVFSASIPTQAPTTDTASGMPPQDVTITGSASVGQDLDQMYKEALTDAFYKAYAKAFPAAAQNESGDKTSNPNEGTDLIAIEKTLGIDDYQILRYWSADGRFNLELKISFDDFKVEQSRLNSFGHFPKLNWVYESAEQIKTIDKTSIGIAAITTRTIEIVASTTGKRLQLIKSEQKPHDVSGGLYVVQDGYNLKVAELSKHNVAKVIYKWNKKLPDILNQYLGKDAIYVIDKTGVIRAFDWENGVERWELPCNKQATIAQLTGNCLSVTIPGAELWIVNLQGEKLWTKRFDYKLITAPVASDNELYCLFENNELKVFDLQTGAVVSTWQIRSMGDVRNIYLGISGKRLFLTYNDKNSHGYLGVYHRFTGDLLWEVSREKTLADSVIVTADAVIIGAGNSIEARDPRFGLKLWEEPVYGLVAKLYRIDDGIFAVAGNRLYSYYY